MMSPTSFLLAILMSMLSIWMMRFYMRFCKIFLQIEKIPGPPVHNTITGHLDFFKNHERTSSTSDWFKSLTNLFQQKNEGLMRLWVGPTQPAVIIFDAELAKVNNHYDNVSLIIHFNDQILMTSNINIDKPRAFDFAIPWLGLGIFTSTGDQWRGHRKMLTPAFHTKILESFAPIINKKLIIMMEIIDKMQSESKGVIDDIRPLITNCIMDIICEIAMGMSINAQTYPDSKYSEAVHKVLDIITMRFLNIFLRNEYIFALTRFGHEQRKFIKYLHNFTYSVIKRKRAKILAEMINCPNTCTVEDSESDIRTKQVSSFLEKLMAQNIKNPRMFTEKDVRANLDTLMSAGFDTTSASVQFSLQLIGSYPQVQIKIQEELDGIYCNDQTRDLKFEDLRHMKYLEKCVKEALRIYPPVLFIARHITEDFKMKQYTIPKGTDCMIFFYQLHRYHKYFPNPEFYDPERFSQENTNKRHAYAYTPFSAGPRNCIGQRLALQIVKAMLASILRKYTITSLMTMDKVELAMGVTTGPKSKITLRFQDRTKFREY